MSNVITDRSDEQKNLRLQQLRAELDAMGYRVIHKDWIGTLSLLLHEAEQPVLAK